VPSRELFVFLVVALPVVGYVLLALTRKPRLRATARQLGASHVDTGWLSPGRIVGRGFTIEPTTRSFGRSPSSYRTVVRVEAPGAPGPFHLRSQFFRAFPDWRYAKVRVRRLQRVFVVQASVQGWVTPSAEDRERLLAWLSGMSAGPALIDEGLRWARIKDMTIDEGHVSTSVPGIVSNPERLRRAVETLGAIQGRQTLGP